MISTITSALHIILLTQLQSAGITVKKIQE